MSWSGFKKNVGRATTQVMMKTGHVEKTSDREYEVEERRYRTLESASLRLQKEAKGYLDSLRAMTASQMRIAETIDAFYGDSGARDGVSRSYKQAVEDLDAETVKALDGPYRSVDPNSYLHMVDHHGSASHEDVVGEIEAELNFAAGNRRTFTAVLEESGGGKEESIRTDALIEYLYRTTVLEPINRFCAYFPDINECIKKRNHKMLDYDAVRAKVKKLVEKPDKDPAKLPRTEKEQEMVGHPQHPFVRCESPEQDDFLYLTIPSPPKALDHIKHIPNLQRDDIGFARRPSRLESVSQRPSSLTLMRSITPMGEARGSMLQRSPSLCLPSPEKRFPSTSMSAEFATPQRSRRSECTSTTGLFTPDPKPMLHFNTTNMASSPLSNINPRHHDSSNRKNTMFFNPSELEEMMRPMKEEFRRMQANESIQAKAVYEQLNDQLTNEIPQLIDLRVPYLDPSFEALVKIQLRFCAEAYSRMAQVQQYLDATTRDQYASGDLDARVEDVLGQIRELSIAGTV